MLEEINFISDSGVRPIKNEDLVNIKRIVGKDLPKEYIELYKKSNGGTTDKNTIYDDDGEEVFCVSCFYNIVSEYETLVNLHKNYNVFFLYYDEIFSDKLYLPFGRDGAGNEMYIDFNEHCPTVCAFMYDEPDEEEGTDFTEIIIAESLPEFFNMLDFQKEE